VIHQPRTFPHVASLNVSTKHTNLPRSYPHVRVTRYEPPRSYHHMLNTSMNLPAHGTTSPDPSKASSLIKNNIPESKEEQHFRLARLARRQAKLSQTAWRYSLPARRQRHFRVTVSSSPPGGAHCAPRHPSVQCPLTLSLSPSGYQWTARRHTRSTLQLVSALELVGSTIQIPLRQFPSRASVLNPDLLSTPIYSWCCHIPSLSFAHFN